MHTIPKIHNAVWLLATAVLVVNLGCGDLELAAPNGNGGNTSPGSAGGGIEGDLKAAHRTYIDYIDHNRQGPPGWDEFMQFAREREESRKPDAIQRVRDTGYQFRWNVKIQHATEGTMNFILAEAPGKPKLTLDGGIR